MCVYWATWTAIAWIVKAVHRGQEYLCWSRLCCSHLMSPCERAALLLCHCTVAQLLTQSWQTPNVSLFPSTWLIPFQEHGSWVLQCKSISQTALGNLSYLSSGIFFRTSNLLFINLWDEAVGRNPLVPLFSVQSPQFMGSVAGWVVSEHSAPSSHTLTVINHWGLNEGALFRCCLFPDKLK